MTITTEPDAADAGAADIGSRRPPDDFFLAEEKKPFFFFFLTGDSAVVASATPAVRGIIPREGRRERSSSP